VSRAAPYNHTKANSPVKPVHHFQARTSPSFQTNSEGKRSHQYVHVGPENVRLIEEAKEPDYHNGKTVVYS